MSMTFRVFKLACLSCASVAALSVAAQAQDAPIVQPGAPGTGVEYLTPEEAVQLAENRYSEADVRFMRGMIVHHQQAVDMSVLVADRTASDELNAIAGRILASQEDEINFMRDWLSARGEDMGMDHGEMGHGAMAGMASPEKMAELAASSGSAFEALFLELMIAHHEGAITMVDELLDQSGSAYDPALFEFISDVKSDQQAEIDRMAALARSRNTDPRSNLAGGFRDAESAISNLTLLASLPKPTGFFDPNSPAGLPPILNEDEVADGEEPRYGERSPYLRFSNTDIAFRGDLMALGNYHGFNLYQVDEDEPRLISSVVCPGGQGDVSIVGDLLFMSVQDTRARIDCGREGIQQDISEERFRGIRIFDISDPAVPLQVGGVQTCRGSHTHSVAAGPNEDGVIIIYNSGTSSVRPEEELAGCVSDENAEDTALYRIDVIAVPVEDPASAYIVDSPAVFADEETGELGGLWRGGDHGEGTQSSRRTDRCHDITVFPSAQLAAGACSGNGILFDISDPTAPRRLDAVVDPAFAYWHSATFNNDGTSVLFTDEWGGGGRPRCRAQDPDTWGANAIFDIVDGKLEFRSYYKLPSAQSEEENCVAHNGNVVPVPGRDIFVQAWYQGGMSIMDFTDSENPIEIGYFDRGPVSNELMVSGGYWSTYWHGGRIYGAEIARGLDVFELTPSEYLTENEIAAAALADLGEDVNPQQQYAASWPDHPVVALAYLDQAVRRGDVSDDADAALRSALTAASSGAGDADQLEALADTLDGDALNDLRETIQGVAVSLR